MTDQNFVKMTNYGEVLKHRNITFRVAFNKTLRASKASGASEAGQVSKLTALFKSKFRSILRFGKIVIIYLIGFVNVLNLSWSS